MLSGRRVSGRGGRYAGDLPQRLRARYETAAHDAELTALYADVALLDTRLSELLGKLDTTSSSDAWKQASRHYADMDASEEKKAKAAKAALGRVLEQGLSDGVTWSEITSLLEQRRKCAESEAKRLAQLDQFITAKQANALVAAVVKLVTEHVSDLTTRRRIAEGLVALVSAGAQPGAGGVAEGRLAAPVDV